MLVGKSKKSAFTIVELLIVIVVIGILAALVISTYSGVQARARDAKRASDIAAIKQALDLYHIDNGGYPLCGSSGVYQPGGSASVCPVTSITQLYTQGYLPSGVKDPTNSGALKYQYASGFRNNTNSCSTNDSSDNYILGASLETGGNVPTYYCWSYNLNYKDGSNN